VQVAYSPRFWLFSVTAAIFFVVAYCRLLTGISAGTTLLLQLADRTYVSMRQRCALFRKTAALLCACVC